MSYRDDRNPPPETTPLTLEEATEKIAKLEKRTAPLWAANVIMFLIFGVGLAVLALNRPKPVTVQHPTEFETTTTQRIDSLAATVAYIKAHTDTTGVNDLRDKVGSLVSLVEQRAADIDRLRIDVNRIQINGVRP